MTTLLEVWKIKENTEQQQNTEGQSSDFIIDKNF